MKVYTCKIHNGILNEWIDKGVFSTCAKAMEAGSLYIIAEVGDVTLLDWNHEKDEDHNTFVCTDWYQSKSGRIFTRVVTESELDQTL